MGMMRDYTTSTACIRATHEHGRLFAPQRRHSSFTRLRWRRRRGEKEAKEGEEKDDREEEDDDETEVEVGVVRRSSKDIHKTNRHKFH